MSDAARTRQADDAPLRFELLARDGEARAGVLHTRRGPVETPVFMPVGTAGSIKGLLPWQVESLGARMILGNTYHLHLRPGETVISTLGGLHRFCGWRGPILTDSGGYQVFSHGARCRIDDDGVTFRDHIEGSLRRLTPERSIEIQQALGSDVMMALDDCTGEPTERAATEAALERTLAWLPRNFAARSDSGAALFGIVQGGCFDDLRRRSLERTVEHSFDGYALGGVSVGEGREDVRRIVATFGPELPPRSPRYLMGMGRPEDIVEAVAAGFDMFDCVIPTRHGRNAQVFTSSGLLNMRNASLKEDRGPLDEGCGCPICRRFSRGYLRHLYVAGEMLGPIAGTIHNLWFYLELVARLRRAILDGRFEVLRRELLARFGASSR